MATRFDHGGGVQAAKRVKTFADKEVEQFRSQLLDWFTRHARDLPWRRRTQDAYAILVSEIMLQQTRVQAVIPYYERFLRQFPTFESLASACESDVLAAWAGLGYYHRARNLQKAARLIRKAGYFPATSDEIRRLPGVGDYTAAAVASISFGVPQAVLDGNVMRVLSRVFDDQADISAPGTRKYFAQLAERLLDRNDAGAFNQAMMELGATICLPNKPQCLLCPVSQLCRALRNGRESELPVNKKPRRAVEERRVVLWIERHGRVLVWQRPSTSRLMPEFWELPEVHPVAKAPEGRKIGFFRHTITFHRYLFEVIETGSKSASPDMGRCKWMRMSELDTRPVSTIFRKARRLVERYRTTDKARFQS